MSVSVRPLATPFDAPTGPTSVATPSCCCCCCCCVNTVVGVTAFTAAEAFHQAHEHRRPITLSVLAAVLLPLLAAFAVGSAINGRSTSAHVVVFGAAGAYLLATAAALTIAGVTAPQAALIALCVTAVAVAAFFAELFTALLTVFLLELAFPLAAWGGVALARQRKKARQARAMHDGIGRGELPPPSTPGAW